MTIFGRPVFYGWVIVVAAFMAQFVAVGVQTSVAAVFAPEMVAEFGWSRFQFFFADTIGQLLLMVIGFMLGPRVDRFGARPIMLGAAVVCIPALVLMSQVDEYWQYIVVRGVFLVTAASVSGFLVVSIAVSKWFVVKRGQALGWTSMGVSMAGLFWPTFTAAILIEPLGWRTAWVVLALCYAVIFLPSALLMRRRPEDHGLLPDGGPTQLSPEQIQQAAHDESTSLTRSEALRSSSFYLIVLIFGISVVGIFAILLNGVFFLREHGLSAAQAPLAVGAFSLFSMLTKPPWGWALDRWDTRVVGFVSFALGAIGFVLVINAGPTGSFAIIAGALAIMGAGIGGNIPIQDMFWAEYFGRRYLGAVRAVGFPVAMGISALTPSLVALAYDVIGSYDYAFYVCSGLWAASALLCLLLRLPAKRRTPLQALVRAVAAWITPSTNPAARPAEQKRGVG
ncbi:MAG: MFS transporter [Chloroflexi bacterium]|nr:MFS transporter [Chloroflexota bacterium]MCY3696882.1 MFS transporter [Chloroflexota bacterium]MYB21094.1 MFS transporter [Chloroflexota bacterium]MYI05015.1 MFS transporter [Chloroflexota bacterium]